MKVSDLIVALQKFSPTCEVMVLDGFNGGGVPRTLNYGPQAATITPNDAEETADCEDRTGETVVCIGFGCY